MGGVTSRDNALERAKDDSSAAAEVRFGTIESGNAGHANEGLLDGPEAGRRAPRLS